MSPRPAVRWRGSVRVNALPIRLEYPLHLVGRDAKARIGEADPHFRGGDDAAELQLAACLGELDRVAEEIQRC